MRPKRVQFKTVRQEMTCLSKKRGLGILLQLMTSCLTVSDFRRGGDAHCPGQERTWRTLAGKHNTDFPLRHLRSPHPPRTCSAKSQQKNTHVVSPLHVKCFSKMQQTCSLNGSYQYIWPILKIDQFLLLSNIFLNLLYVLKQVAMTTNQQILMNVPYCLRQACYSAAAEAEWNKPQT